MSRFYVQPQSIRDDKIHVEKEERHHIVDVMRLGEGDAVVAFDGRGNEYVGVITCIDAKEVIIDIKEVKTPDSKRNFRITLAQAIPKKDKMDTVVQKATELGVDEIIPLSTERTIVKADNERIKSKIERWRRIAIEASKQCGRTELPLVRPMLKFNDLIEMVDNYNFTIMPCLSEDSISLYSALADIKESDKSLVMIGPEGGFTEAEKAAAASHGVILVSLGDLVLKSDTAAIATLSVLNYEYKCM
ncbi:MAG: 16S rRNA (uracil(1498)-N(3))-methyltransferase [Candidatus Omnitrophica bacterium]|nr:16S rRNA (uracil(1498)-N(3))-methyltransferase [Candidatus Omnitrophota bacterium]